MTGALARRAVVGEIARFVPVAIGRAIGVIEATRSGKPAAARSAATGEG